MPKCSINYEEIFSRDHGNFEEHNEVLESSIIIINYCIVIIINAYYNCIIRAKYNYYISNKGLLEECDKEENVAVAGAATASRLKRRLSNVLPNVIIRPVTARPSPQR